jgi:hypothetical protein
MRHGDLPGTVPRSPSRGAAGPVLACDRGWPARLRTAYAVSSTALGVTVLLDGMDGTMSLPRTLTWIVLAALLFAVLLPPRTTAGDGWLAVRGLLRTHRVRTDHLVSVCTDGAIDRRVLLRDAFGARAAVDRRVLIANPFLWHQLDQGARHSHAAGLLPDRAALRDLAETIDTAESRTLLISANLR